MSFQCSVIKQDRYSLKELCHCNVINVTMSFQCSVIKQGMYSLKELTMSLTVYLNLECKWDITLNNSYSRFVFVSPSISLFS